MTTSIDAPATLIIGATSAIAQETAKILAARNARIMLVGRDTQRLEAIAQDLKVRGAKAAETLAVDLADPARHVEIVERTQAAFGRIDIALIAHGILGNQEAAQASYEVTYDILNVNFLSYVSLLTPLANLMERQARGSLAVISSVAGDRGRQSNYVYGAAKGGLTIFLQGLRNRLFPKGVHVLTIKPGFVDTPMTAHLPKGPLFVKPDVVARGICKAIDHRCNVVYLPIIWWVIMSIIKAIPETIFKRLKL